MIVLSLVVMGAALGAEPEAATSLRVMSYNLRYGSADDGVDSWDHRRSNLVDLIAEHDPDVVGTQECLDFQAAHIVEQLPQYQWFGQGRQDDGTGEMTAILYKRSKLLVLESGHLWLSETPEIPGSKSWDSSLPRIASWVKFYHRSTGRAFYVYNTHFDHKGVVAREKSAGLLEARITERHPDDLVIVTGDFNASGPDSAPWKALTAGGLQDTWEVATEKAGDANTWNGFKTPLAEQFRRIDWILVSDGARVPKCEIDGRDSSGRFPSDHMPVIAEIALDTDR